MPSSIAKKNKKTTPKKKMNLGGSATKRNYANERKYDSQPIVKKKRVLRNAARNKLLKAGVVKKYDGKDVHHVGGNALNPNSKLQAVSASKNRSYPRTKTARKLYRTS